MTRPVFPDFSGLWVPLCLAREVPKAKPLEMTLAGERIVMFRDAAGGIHALIDRCPHRGVALPLRVAGGRCSGRNALSAPVVPAALSLPGVCVTAQSSHWQVHWTRVMENMLDTPHRRLSMPAPLARRFGGGRRKKWRWLGNQPTTAPRSPRTASARRRAPACAIISPISWNWRSIRADGVPPT